MTREMMKQSESIISLIRCPISGNRLHPADQDLVVKVNASISSGNLENRIGQTVREQLSGALIDESGTWIVPIRQDVICMVGDQIIENREW